jgi:5-aminopentanamidase
MVINPFGDILSECRTFDDSFVIATVTFEKLNPAWENRYIKAGRRNLYRDIIEQNHESKQKVVWLHRRKEIKNCR